MSSDAKEVSKEAVPSQNDVAESKKPSSDVQEQSKGNRNSGRSKKSQEHRNRNANPSHGTEKRKRPEVQHYKPGAFSSKKVDESGSQDSGQQTQNNGNVPKRSGKGRGGNGEEREEKKQQTQSKNVTDQVANELAQVTLDSKSRSGEAKANRFQGGGKRKRRPDLGSKPDKKENSASFEGSPREPNENGKSQPKSAPQPADTKPLEEGTRNDGGKNEGGNRSKRKPKSQRGNKDKDNDKRDAKTEQSGKDSKKGDKSEAVVEKKQAEHSKEDASSSQVQKDAAGRGPRANNRKTKKSNVPDNEAHTDSPKSREQANPGKGGARGRREYQRGGGRGGGYGHRHKASGGSVGGGGGGDVAEANNATAQNKANLSAENQKTSSTPIAAAPEGENPSNRNSSEKEAPSDASKRSVSPRFSRVDSESSENAPFQQRKGIVYVRGGTFGRSGRGGRTRDDGDWSTQRNFGDRWENETYYDKRNDRGMSRGRVSSSRMPYQNTKQPAPAKQSLPPRFQRAKERSDFGDYRDYISNRNDSCDSWDESYRDRGDRSWKDYDQQMEGSGSRHQSVSPNSSLSTASNAVSSLQQPCFERELSAHSSRLVSDWSLEVEEEEERMEMNKWSEEKELQKQRQVGFDAHHSKGIGSASRGGLLRLPSSASNRSKQGNPAHDNSHWGETSNEDQSGPCRAPNRDKFGSGGQQRFLFDPKNPNKPIPAMPGSRPQVAGSMDSEPPARFSIDPRFGQRLPPPPHPGYRPPFSSGPAPRQPPQMFGTGTRMMVDQSLMEQPTFMKIVSKNESILRQLSVEGGPHEVCNRWNKEVFECRRNIMRGLEELLKADLVFCVKNDIEFYIWKICFYNVIEVLRHGIRQDDVGEMRKLMEKNIAELLDEGMDFYAQMLDVLDSTYRLNLKQYLNILEPRPTDKRAICALISAQKCFLCLGDLARYKEQIQETSNYGKAKQYYQKASYIEPLNGRPFNQLAILAVNMKRKFEAVYYNMRCLMSKNPFTSSRDSLTVIFDEVKKKWETQERRRMEEKESDSSRHGNVGHHAVRLRNEIWVRPESGRRLQRTISAQESLDSDDGALQDMSTVDLNRRFNNTFLYLIGKLFTGIDMDKFPFSLDLLIKEFRVLTSHSPLPIDAKRLVQIMALNMFIIDHTKLKQGGGEAQNYRSALQDSALQLAFQMFGILVERANHHLDRQRPVINVHNQQSIFEDEDLTTLLASVKVWCDWLLGNSDIWYPVVNADPFTQLAKLATHLEHLKGPMKPVLNNFITEDSFSALSDKTQFELVKLEEDAMLCGFQPWFRGMDWSVYRRYAHKSVPVTLAQDIRRLDAINFCIDFLEGLESPVMKWSLPDNAHLSLIDNSAFSRTQPSTSRERGDILAESYIEEVENRSQSSSRTIDSDNFETSSLKRRKDELLKHQMENERLAKDMQRAQQEILAENVSITLEVRPRILVPDTNCFVDFLPEIRKLSSCNQYQVFVPLMVVNELEGLSKGGFKVNVQENARRALVFLRERPPNMRCVTSKGTLIPSFTVTTEEDFDSVVSKKNDDRILDTCLSVIKAHEKRKPVHEEKKAGRTVRTIFREVVLLTDDANLRLKAHVNDMPVNRINDFIEWAFSN